MMSLAVLAFLCLSFRKHEINSPREDRGGGATKSSQELSPQKSRNSGYFHLGKVVSHEDLKEPKDTKDENRFGRPLSYKRTQAKASVSNELHGMCFNSVVQTTTRVGVKE